VVDVATAGELVADPVGNANLPAFAYDRVDDGAGVGAAQACTDASIARTADLRREFEGCGPVGLSCPHNREWNAVAILSIFSGKDGLCLRARDPAFVNVCGGCVGEAPVP